MKILITGGTGFVGDRLSDELLLAGHEITATGTSASHRLANREGFRYVRADTTRKGDWQDLVREQEAVVNLAGRTIFKYWTGGYKQMIYDSRILTTRNIVEALPNSTGIRFLSTSALGFYGDRGNETLTESSSGGDDFLAGVCRDWEAEADQAGKKGARVALMRFGVVLGRGGGALAKMLPAFKFGFGGPLGSGTHWFPWIHMDDLIGAIRLLLKDHEIQGPLNFCSPEQVQQHEFAAALGKALKRPSFMRVPAFAIRMLMGELGKSLLQSQRAAPEKLLEAGFSFAHPRIQEALQDLTA